MENSVTITAPDGFIIDQEKSIFTKEFSNIVFKKISVLPKSWEEIGSLTNKFYVANDKVQTVSNNNFRTGHSGSTLILPTENTALATIYLNKLLLLRDIYRQSWTPNWDDSKHKHCISYEGNVFKLVIKTTNQKIFSFQSADIRDDFFNNFESMLKNYFTKIV